MYDWGAIIATSHHNFQALLKTDLSPAGEGAKEVLCWTFMGCIPKSIKPRIIEVFGEGGKWYTLLLPLLGHKWSF